MTDTALVAVLLATAAGALAGGAWVAGRRKAAECMTGNPILVGRRELAATALDLMENRKITSLLVTDAGGRVEGVLHLHDLWKTEMI